MSFSVLKVFISVFTIMGPFTVLPVFITMTDGMSQSQRNHVARKAMLVSSAILIMATVAGEEIFYWLGISISSFRIAGGILVLLMGINMLHAKRSSVRATDSELEEAKVREDIYVFPLGTPLIAGPGAISTVVLFSTGHRNFTTIFTVVASVVVSAIIFYFMLRYSRYIYKVLGETGNNIIMRLMGLVLSAMAVEFIINGIKDSFSNFFQS
ncbi:MAG TPA: MarC family protein [bacterium]|nr:MarC family protein [bacterium]